MSFSVGKRLGPYEVVRLLGRGGMGEVYLALDERLRRHVALKLLREDVASDPARRARFEREARLAAALHHPHICTIYEIGEWDGQLCIAMEYVEGTTLEERVAAGPLTIGESMRIATQSADALEAARQAHVVHRDLKSANIVITPRGDVKILDFGLAKLLEEPGAPSLTTAEALSEAGVVMGTAGYMAPEQVLGQPADHRSDLFSLGVVLYEMMAGRRPFSGATSMTVLDAILHQSPPPIARFNDQVPDPLARVVVKLLEKDPGRRYQTAQDVYNDLERVQHESTARVASVGPSARGRAGRWLLAAAAVVVLGIGGVAWWPRLRSASAVDMPSIVVLPAEISGPPDSTSPYEYLRDAVPATLSTRLAAIDGLETKVPPTTV
jgi:serine/threonine protein kinase